MPISPSPHRLPSIPSNSHRTLAATGLWMLVWGMTNWAGAREPSAADSAFESVRQHPFHPIREGFTYDRELNTHGVADLGCDDWKVRLIAVRDLVRLGAPGTSKMLNALADTNAHVRQVSAMVLGILRATNAVPALEAALAGDHDEVVRSQAAASLGQIALGGSLAVLRRAQTNDNSRDVQHQAELAAYAVEHNKGASPELAAAYIRLDENRFQRLRVGEPAIDFQLPDTDGHAWRLSDFRGKKPVVLIWIFADWCPVCHGEFRELMELRAEFATAGIQVFTLECHDTFPARVMVGKELEPKYWFSKASFQDGYTKNIWWPHLVDRAGAVGAEYGVQPMAFTVHSEWINRPSVVSIDKEGFVRFAYYGTFWGDRPSIRQALDMVRSGDFNFAAPRRLHPSANSEPEAKPRPVSSSDPAIRSGQ